MAWDLKISEKELKKLRKEIIEERKRFIELYVKWLKKVKAKRWSKEQKKLIDSAVKAI